MAWLWCIFFAFAFPEALRLLKSLNSSISQSAGFLTYSFWSLLVSFLARFCFEDKEGDKEDKEDSWVVRCFFACFCYKDKEGGKKMRFLVSFLVYAFLEACHVIGLGILFFYVLPR